MTDLEREGVELERAVALFDEGRALVAQCEKMLVAAEERLRQTAVPDTAPAAEEPLEEEEIPF
ncbi:MAG TPA: exodeoxyribonuclease VII small subunit [Candidatus Sulfotelmatobacter sp.]|nr:exodeoxyribonuclease VII small subunit [Candidatus Sulfotelmatobacter sp.]